METGELPGPQCDAALERLVLLSDGVFAIAITLLAIELRLPETAEHQERGELLRAIGSTWPHIFAFVQSFSILALFWASHHRLFLRIERADGALVILNLAFLLTVAFQPFPTAVIGEHFGDPAAGLLYFRTLIATTAALWGIWHYVTAPHRRLCPNISPRLIRHYHNPFPHPDHDFSRAHAALLLVPGILHRSDTLFRRARGRLPDRHRLRGAGHSRVPRAGLIRTPVEGWWHVGAQSKRHLRRRALRAGMLPSGQHDALGRAWLQCSPGFRMGLAGRCQGIAHRWRAGRETPRYAPAC